MKIAIEYCTKCNETSNLEFKEKEENIVAED